MPIFNFSNNELKKVPETSFTTEKILERQNLQAAIKKRIDIVSPNSLVIAEEFSEWSDSQKRIDLLAIDKDAKLVVIELKRNETGEYMELQSIRYAAMVSTLTFSKAVSIYQAYLSKNKIDEYAESKMLDFLGWEEPQEDDFALDVRIILVSANFSKELTTSVMWLNERNIDIRCVRFSPYKYQGDIFIDVQQIIPLPEVEIYQVKIKQQSEERREARNHQKDYTQYIFNGLTYNKRKIVLAIISTWVKDNNPETFKDLITAFPQEIHAGSLFIPLKKAIEIYERQKIYRHFLNDNEIVTIQDKKYAISNQWGKGNIEHFINRSRELGFEIQEKS